MLGVLLGKGVLILASFKPRVLRGVVPLRDPLLGGRVAFPAAAVQDSPNRVARELVPRAIFGDSDKRCAVMPKQAVRSAQPQPAAAVFQDVERERCDAEVLVQLRECVAVISIQGRVLAGKPHIPGWAFVNTPDLLALNGSLLGEVGEALSIKPTDAPVDRPEPDVPRFVLENTADGVVRQAV